MRVEEGEAGGECEVERDIGGKGKRGGEGGEAVGGWGEGVELDGEG